MSIERIPSFRYEFYTFMTTPVIFSFRPLLIHSVHHPVHQWHCALYVCDIMMFHHSAQRNITECGFTLVQTAKRTATPLKQAELTRKLWLER
jgi:hypothetical protein